MTAWIFQILQEFGTATREPETAGPSCSCSLAPPSQSRGSLTSEATSSSNSSTSSGYCAEVNDDTDSSEDDYHDAVEEVAPDDDDDAVDGNEATTEPMESSADSSTAAVAAKPRQKRQRRKRIPDSPNLKFSVWSFIKNNIGKDFAKSPLPVNLNEPLSLLQRMVEQMLYSELLYKGRYLNDVDTYLEEANVLRKVGRSGSINLLQKLYYANVI